MPPLFSIVTPSYNQAAFVEETLRSVLEQDYPAIEYLVADGASSDGSAEIIQRYAPRLAWWVSEKDRGQAQAINKGFARASGEYVAWLNSDDVYRPGALAAVARAFAQNPRAGMVFGDVESIDGQGQVFNVMTFRPITLDDLLCFNIICQPGVFLRRSVLQQTGLLDDSYHYLLDHHLWVRALSLAPAVYLPQRLAAARYHADAKNVAQAAAFGREAFRIIDWMQTRPELADAYRRLRRRIWAGAYRFDGRYLQDGGQNRAALAAYLRSLAAHPPTALTEWRRMVYAAASLVVNPERLKRAYLQRRREKMQGKER